MASDIRRVLGPVTWTKDVNGASGTTTAPSLATHGTAVDPDLTGEFVHVAVAKTNTATIAVWGYTKAVSAWFRLEASTLSTTANEAVALQVAAAYDRLAVQVTALGGGSLSAWIGQGV